MFGVFSNKNTNGSGHHEWGFTVRKVYLRLCFNWFLFRPLTTKHFFPSSFFVTERESFHFDRQKKKKKEKKTHFLSWVTGRFSPLFLHWKMFKFVLTSLLVNSKCLHQSCTFRFLQVGCLFSSFPFFLSIKTFLCFYLLFFTISFLFIFFYFFLLFQAIFGRHVVNVRLFSMNGDGK